MSAWQSSRLTGPRAWWVQRVSAVVMLIFVLFLLYSFGTQPLRTYAQWRTWVERPILTWAFLLFLIALLAHMWVGLRDVLLDYARPAGVRNALLALLAIALIGLFSWLLIVLFRLQS